MGNREYDEKNCGCEEMSCPLRLAHAYVPWQIWPDELYDPTRALMVGTIFPQLNQPMSEYEWGEVR